MSQNNSNDKATMMSHIEKINQIEGFDPTPFAIEYGDLSAGESRKRLPVVIRIAMFRMKYDKGKIAIHTKEEKDGYVATARVYPDYKDSPDEFLAEASAFRAPCPDKPSVSAREWAQTAAVGIALRNAGFGVQFDVAGEDVPETMGDNIPNASEPSKNDVTPAAVPPTPSKEVSPPTAQTEALQTTPEANTETEYTVASDFSTEGKTELTYEEKVQKAMMLPCPIEKFGGKTLGEVLREDPKALVWTATKFSGDANIKEAAKLICEYSQKQAEQNSNE